MDNKSYPRYLSYGQRKLPPSVLLQEYPLPSLDIGEVYYPPNKYLSRYLTTEEEFQYFGALQFCTFLRDTIHVELGLVIPAVNSTLQLPFKIPPKPIQDLIKTATDEGHHAEQSFVFFSALQSHFGITDIQQPESPLFIRRLNHQRSLEKNSVLNNLITVLNGVVTETRISVELGHFAKNNDLSDSIRRICKSHAQDEVVHASQFQVLGKWLWEDFNEETKSAAAQIYVNSSIARSLPDIDNLIISFSNATERTTEDAARIVLSEYDENILIDEMLFAADPTFTFLEKLGIKNYLSIDDEIQKEKERLHREITKRRRSLRQLHLAK